MGSSLRLLDGVGEFKNVQKNVEQYEEKLESNIRSQLFHAFASKDTGKFGHSRTTLILCASCCHPLG
jgi:hypothetical protein